MTLLVAGRLARLKLESPGAAPHQASATYPLGDYGGAFRPRGLSSSLENAGVGKVDLRPLLC